MKTVSRASWFAAPALIAALSGGCASNPRPINPGTGIVDLKVWCVLANADPFVGNSDNIGCRLSVDDIKQRVHSLQSHAIMYGENVTFRWPGEIINVVGDAQLPNSVLDPRTQDVDLWNFGGSIVLASWNDPNAVNVYFVGNVNPPANPTAAWAATLDPQAASSNGVPPWMIINDGGFTTGFGFVSGGDPTTVTSYRIIEHETAHYLARFRNRTFPLTGSVYNPGEHDTAAAPPCYLRANVLRNGGVPCGTGPYGPGYYLVVRGSSLTVNTERYEIWDRIKRGRWNIP